MIWDEGQHLVPGVERNKIDENGDQLAGEAA
jgi:hypothetical protein